MANITIDVHPDSFRCGTTSGTCPKCEHSGDMEWWASTTRFRVLGIPTPCNRVTETLKCTVCGRVHTPR